MGLAKSSQGNGSWLNRIIGYGEEDADQLLGNSANWRVHPLSQQQALAGVLSEVGFVQSVIVNKRTAEIWGQDRGVETIVDGHLRVSLAISRGEKVPVVYVDLDPAEEALILATIDPLSALAVADKGQLDALLREVTSGDSAVQAMLGKLAADTGITKFDPEAEWQGMPEFEQEDVMGSVCAIKVHFANVEDIASFAKLIGQPVTAKSTFIWFPAKERASLVDFSVQDES